MSTVTTAMSETLFELSGQRVWVAGHSGMVGSALVRRLAAEGCEILTIDRCDLDLTRQADVERWIMAEKPQVVFLAAAKVGGIEANQLMPVQFLYDNLMIEANVMHAAWTGGVKKLVFLGSTCIYPKTAAQPVREHALLTGPLEPTNQWYAVAKIGGVKLAEAYRLQYGADYITLQPTNLYGPGDNYDLRDSHVLPALIRKAHEAKVSSASRLTVWGSGTPLREFLHVDDMADAAVYLAKHYSDAEPVNVGSGEEISIRDLALLICQVVGFDGELEFDRSKPDGMPRKRADISKLTALGWNRARRLEQGLRETYAAYCKALAAGELRIASSSEPALERQSHR